ncbi:MAG: BRO family protein [Mariprofundaceae bacterium]|nr:BRO family protein [Mariprofundaceae bacterium]
MSITTICNTFKNTEIRTVDDQGTLWFVSGDIAKALGYRDSANMVRMLDNDERGTRLVSTPSGNQEMNVINESGMYHALIKSRKPEAKPFRKWVTGEVLPSIRKTGTYTLPQTITPKQKLKLRDAMNKKVYDNYGKKKAAVGFKSEWHDFYETFEISKYGELPANRFDDAMKYLLGEWVPESEQAAIPDNDAVVDKTSIKALCKLVGMTAEDYSVSILDIEAKVSKCEILMNEISKEQRAFRASTWDKVRDSAWLAKTISKDLDKTSTCIQ